MAAKGRTRRAARRLVPWAAWAVALGVMGWLYHDLGDARQGVGMADLREIAVEPVVAGRVARVLVRPGDAVEAGEVLASLDTSLIDAEIAVLDAEVRRLTAELERQRIDLVADRLEQSRRLSSDAERTALALTRTRADEARARTELEQLVAELERQRGLVARELAPADRLRQLERQKAALERELEGHAQAIRLLSAQSSATLDRLALWRRMGSNGEARAEQTVGSATLLRSMLGPMEQAVEVAQRQLERAQREREALVLRAAAPAHVEAVHLRPGAVARPGVPVVTLVTAEPGSVLAWVDEWKGGRIEPGQRVRLRPRSGGRVQREGVVVAVAPSISEVPPRLRARTAQRAWGRKVVIRVGGEGEKEPVPGQTFDVSFLGAGGDVGRAAHAVSLPSAPRPQESAGATPEAAPGPGPPAPQPMAVPPELARRTRMEPSGLVHVPEWDGYLLVSDDTGQEDADEHAPWVFRMGADGALDRAPVVIEGLDEVRDLEGAARGPSAIWLVSSQGPTKRGVHRSVRQMLTRLRPEPGPRIVHTGSVRLLTAIDAAARAAGGDAWLHTLGLGARGGRPHEDDGAPSDLLAEVEALAWVGDALLVGLKSPQTAAGEAIVWRLARPDHLVETGALDPADLTVHARHALPLPVPGGTTPGGVSGLEPLPGGDLALLSTAPAEDAGDVGALWLIHAGTPPRLVRSFPGLKPEGVAAGPGESLLVVFDRGGDAPLWLAMTP